MGTVRWKARLAQIEQAPSAKFRWFVAKSRKAGHKRTASARKNLVSKIIMHHKSALRFWSLRPRTRPIQNVLVPGGFHHAESDRPERSPYLACYYQNIAANVDDIGGACYFYSRALGKLSEKLHDGYAQIPGSNAVPAMSFG